MAKPEVSTGLNTSLNESSLTHQMKNDIGVSPQVLKIILTSGLFVLTILASLSPIKCIAFARKGSLKRRRNAQKVISLLSCFAGGVFLGACFLDLFPEVKETMDEAFEELGIESEFPVPEFVMIYGLFIVLITEQVVVHYQERGVKAGLGGHGHSHGPPSPQRQPRITFEVPVDENDEDSDDEKSSLVPKSDDSAPANGGYGSLGHCAAPSDAAHANYATADSGSLDYSHAHSRHHRDDPTAVHHHHHRHHHNEQLSDRHSSLRAFLLTLALTLHSLFEGMALGLLQTTDQIVSIFVALIIHKLVMGFSLGLNLVQSEMGFCSVVISCAVFSVTSPVGAAIGIVVSDGYQTPTSHLISGGFQGIACGTFLYVTFFEVLPHEMNSGGNRLLKVLSILLGFSLIALLMIFLPA